MSARRASRTDRRGQRTAAGAAAGRQLDLRAGLQQHLHLLGQPARRRAEQLPRPVQRDAAGQRENEPQHHDQRKARLDQRPQRGALRRLQRAEQYGRRSAEGQAQHDSRQTGRSDLTQIGLHRAQASISRTRAASSCVENGLVM
jgi:hypothetical protein